MEPDRHILIVDSNSASFAEDMKKMLSGIGFESCEKTDFDRSVREYSLMNPDLIILDPALDAELSIKCIHKFKIINPSIPILTSSRECLPSEPCYAPFEGVYLLNPGSGQDSVLNAIATSFRQKAEFALIPDPSFIIGLSPGITSVRKKIRNIADKDVTVLVTGETGTGKELVARSIHFHSKRNKRPLVKVDCTSLPDELLESEVFGFQKGAFTDAYRDKPGRLELADGGTIFIDEIGDISLSLQVKFMQVFEESEFSRLGGISDKTVDVRVVVATNADLRKKVHDGTFRKDLYYRLNIIRIDVPPLRERKDDIPLLIHFFQNKYCFEFKKELKEIPNEVIRFFMSYDWPGNVRELENTMRRGIAVSDWSFIFEDLKREITGSDMGAESTNEASKPSEEEKSEDLLRLFKENEFSLKKISKAYVTQAELEAIKNALKSAKWNRKKAAQMLGVSYKTLINRIEELGLRP